MSLIRTKRTWLLLVFVFGAFGAVWGGLMLSSAVAHGPHHLPQYVALIPWLLYSVTLFLVGRHYERSWRTWDAEVRANEQGLHLDGRLVLARRTIRHAHFMIEGDRVFLRLHRRAPFAAPYDIEVVDEAEARLLLANLRLDAQTSVSEFELTHGTKRQRAIRAPAQFAVGLASMIATTSLMRPYGGAIALPAFGAACALILYFMASSVMQVAVGTDGLHLKRTFRRARFLPYADIRDLRLDGRDLHLMLADGSSIALHREDEGATLEARIREALSLHRARNLNAAAAVNRGGRTTSEWLEATKERRATYREAAVPDEELWNIVEDAAASPTERAGAALSLRKELNDAGRDRLRIAAGACAEKKLRVALESVAENATDDALEDVLEPLEDRRVKKLSRS